VYLNLYSFMNLLFHITALIASWSFSLWSFISGICSEQCRAVQCSAVQCSAVQCSAVQCSAVQCSTVQCSAVQSRAVPIKRGCYMETEGRGQTANIHYYKLWPFIIQKLLGNIPQLSRLSNPCVKILQILQLAPNALICLQRYWVTRLDQALVNLSVHLT
jgi:hypothetical protein